MDKIEKEIDKLGRIVLPKAYRDILGLKAHDKLSVSLENSTLILSKPESLCVLCNSRLVADVKIPLCESCILKIKSI